MVSYSFYKQTYGGSQIDQASWTYYANRAAAYLRKIAREYTVTVPEDDTDAEAKAVCAIAETLCSLDLVANGEGGAVTSAKIGSVSVSYGTAAEIDLSEKGQKQAIMDAASLYLDIDWGCVVFL